MNDFVLQPAGVEEIPSVIALLESAARWLHNKGIAQWQSPLPVSFIKFMQNEALAGHVFLVKVGNEKAPSAMFRTAYQDLGRWNDNGFNKALYIYSLAIRDNLHGMGIGSIVLDMIKQLAAQEEKNWLRLDCWALNSRLKSYYTTHGFDYMGDIDDEGYPLSLFQMRITSDG